MTMSETVAFTRMDEGTYEDYQLLERLYKKLDHELVGNVIGLLDRLKGDKLGYKIDRYDHSLQSATRALRDGADEETVVIALLHDIGDTVAPHNHSDLAAAVLQPYISADNHWLVQHHGVFQGYYYFHHCGGDRFARERFRGHPMFERTAMFCERYDQNSFDPNYDTLPIDTFMPMMRRILARPPFGTSNGIAPSGAAA
jgi:predicted HD phosphohydrolase